jgi:hypothetical protein
MWARSVFIPGSGAPAFEIEARVRTGESPGKGIADAA